MDVTYRELTFLGYPGYRVGTDGSVWTRWKTRGRGIGHGRGVESYLSDEWRQMKPIPQSRRERYWLVSLADRNHVKKNWFIHHLVLLAFVGPCPEGMQACHYPDRDTRNNRADNLRWGSDRDNHDDQDRHGTRAKGERHGMCRHSDEEMQQMADLRHTNPVRWTYRKLARRYKISVRQCHAICTGKSRPYLTECG